MKLHAPTRNAIVQDRRTSFTAYDKGESDDALEFCFACIVRVNRCDQLN